jgi:hypothetical protein
MANWRSGLIDVSPKFGMYGVTFTKSGIAQLAAPVVSLKPEVNTRDMSVTAVLTTRTPDRQGDVIDPLGGNFSEHESNPVVMFHHGKTHKLPIGKAEDKNGNYTVKVVKSQDGGHAVIGTTHFAQKNKFANDVFGLVAEDILRGVSIGFDPMNESGAVEELGPSPVLKRPALHFKGWNLLEYSHTPIGVNRDALTVAVQKGLDGSRPLHPELLKYLQPLAHPRKTTVTATIPTVRKAMDDDDVGMGDEGDLDGAQDAGFEPAVDDPSQDPQLAEMGGAYADAVDDAPSPTVQALLDGSQGLLDLCTATEGAMKKSEHMKGRKYATKFCADLRKAAAEAKSFAEKIKAELAGPMDSDGDDDSAPDAEAGDEAGDDADVESDEDAPEPETDDDGAIISKGYSPRRWTHADLHRAGAAPAPTAAAPGAPANLKALESENKKLRAELTRATTILNRVITDAEAGQARR